MITDRLLSCQRGSDLQISVENQTVSERCPIYPLPRVSSKVKLVGLSTVLCEYTQEIHILSCFWTSNGLIFLPFDVLDKRHVFLQIPSSHTATS